MRAQEKATTIKSHQSFYENDSAMPYAAHWKTATCVVLSLFYFAVLAYPFGVSAQGFVLNKAIIAAVIFFAISIPAWIINIKREFFSPDQATTETEAEPANEYGAPKIGELAIKNNWLSFEEIKQILFCQEGNGLRFGEIAVKRNYLSPDQVNSLLALQAN